MSQNETTSSPALRAAVKAALLTIAATGIGLVTAGAAVAADLGSNERHAYFGDLHLHTSYSFDAYVLLGAKIDPDQAYKFARGEPVPYLGETIRRSTPPLDFMAVTDHSENIGVFNTLEDPESPLSKSDIGQEVRKLGTQAFGKLVQLMTSGHPLPGVDVGETSRSAWQREIEFANSNYQPGTFTTFIAYEWSSMPDGQNLHRNVIFRGNSAPNPFSSVDSNKPENLWTWLDAIRKQGYEALAIPHNSNASNGLMFDWVDSRGKPIDQAYAEDRARNEPLAEISQNKGSSETLPELSPDDEFANFERYDHLLVSPIKSKPGGSYVRDGLGRGLIIASQDGGANPFKYGVVGASDYHNGLSDSAEAAYGGGAGAIDPSKAPPDPQQILQQFGSVRSQLSKLVKLPPGATPPPEASPLQSYYETGSGNLTGVWAEQNTRESIYDALRRKETFATSGTRLKARFFGGWGLQADPHKDRDWVRKAYAGGVPQGGDLPARLTSSSTPRFAVWAVKDPDGANLDRIQVIKLAVKNGKYIERIYDVAASDHRKIDSATHRARALPSTVDLHTAKYTNTVGSTELATTWADPDFDASLPAVYYVRVLEISTPRWSTITAVKRGEPLPDGFPPTIQERAWTSPIWYTPQAAPSAAPLLTADQEKVDKVALSLLSDPGVKAAREAGEKAWLALPSASVEDGPSTLKAAVDEAVYLALRAAAAYDPANPKVVWAIAPPYSYGTIKVPGSRYAGDSPDRIYRTVAVDPSHRYEIHGQRRAQPSNDDFSFEAVPSVSLVAPPAAALTAKDIDVAADGSFTITLDSSAAGQRNHLLLPPGTKAVLIRDTLADWSTQLPDALTIKRIDGASAVPRSDAELRRLAAQEVANVFQANVGFLSRTFKTPVNRPKANIRKPEDGVAGAIAAGSPFSINSDEALVVTIDPGSAKYVGFQLTDPWFRSRPYWNATGSLSSRQAKANADGSITYVIAARDPGYYNWLDTGGLRNGTLLVRVEHFDKTPDPEKVVREARVVKLADLASAVPQGAVRVTPNERAKQLAERHAGYERRVAHTS